LKLGAPPLTLHAGGAAGYMIDIKLNGLCVE